MPEWITDPGVLALIGTVILGVLNIRRSRVEASAPDKIAEGFDKLNTAHQLEIQNLRQEISDLETKHKLSITSLEEKYKQAIAALEKKYQAELRAELVEVRAEYDARITEMEAKHQKEIKGITLDYEILSEKHNQLVRQTQRIKTDTDELKEK